MQYQPVDVPGDRYVLVVRVPRSWASPHRVTVGGHAHFYGRNSKECYPLDVSALRNAFGISDSVLQRIKSFRLDRVVKLNVGDTPVSLVSGAIMALHVVPFSAFAPDAANNLWPSSEDRHRQFGPLDPMAGGCVDVNFEGFVTFGSRGAPSATYSQVSRLGWIESALVFQPWGEDDDRKEYMIPSPWFEETVLKASQRFTAALLSNEIAGPYWLALSFMRAKGYRLHIDKPWSRHRLQLREDMLICPGTIAEATHFDPATLWQTTFDRIHNAFGFEQSR